VKVAIVYDRVNKLGGAERVLQALHRLYPQAPLYTSLYHPRKASWAKSWDVRPSALNKLRVLRHRHECIPMLMPYVFESFNLSKFDIIISVTSAEAKGVITAPHQLHLCYLLTPTRYLWSDTHRYATGRLRVLKQPLLSSLRRWDYIAAQRPDYLIAISKAVAARCQKYYHRKPIKVIYPPVDYQRFTTTASMPKKRYFLIVSRLVDYKKIELAIKVCNRKKIPLKIVGTGVNLAGLKSLAGSTIDFLGLVPDSKLPEVYAKASALIMPQEEDFGIVSLEAQASGVPVISFAKGGAAETIKEYKTGILFTKQTHSSLSHALDRFGKYAWNPDTIKKNAAKFDITSFSLQFKQTVDTLWHKKTP
jgi:glycosyltransferase involved in cell wall biosynthesis